MLTDNMFDSDFSYHRMLWILQQSVFEFNKVEQLIKHYTSGSFHKAKRDVTEMSICCERTCGAK